MVGCVIVREDRTVAEGHHAAAGQPHAEIVALREAGPRATRATVYVSLEPCCTHGRTPPCTDALVEAGVARVVAATVDPNPKVSGKGFARLREAGIDVADGVLSDLAAKQNESYFKWITTGMPFVTAKWAMSLDGKITARRGERTRLTGDEANGRVHEMRAASDAIMAGIGTVLADDPELTARLAEWNDLRPPTRVIVDSAGRTPPTAKVMRTARDVPVLIVVTARAEEDRLTALRDLGAEIVKLPEAGMEVDVRALAAELGRREISSLLLEGGAQLNGSMLAAGLIDKIVAFISPVVFASAQGVGAVETGTDSVVESLALTGIEVEQLGEDLMISGYPAGRND